MRVDDNDQFVKISGSWIERLDLQEAHEDSVEMDERETEASPYMQPCGSSKTVPVYHLVYKAHLPAGNYGCKSSFQTKVLLKASDYKPGGPWISCFLRTSNSDMKTRHDSNIAT